MKKKKQGEFYSVLDMLDRKESIEAEADRASYALHKKIGNHLESLGFIPQEFDKDWSEAIAFNQFLIMPEFPNGGMTALSVMDTVSGQWWSLPTGLGKHCPDGMKNFDYHQDVEAIAWLKDDINKFEELAP